MIEPSVKVWSMILCGKIKSLTQHIAGYQYQIWSLKFMLVFFFYVTLSSYNNIFETETLYFLVNMKVLSGHLYTR